MTDIDFDELDRAVASLMEQRKTAESPDAVQDASSDKSEPSISAATIQPPADPFTPAQPTMPSEPPVPVTTAPLNEPAASASQPVVAPSVLPATVSEEPAIASEAINTPEPLVASGDSSVSYQEPGVAQEAPSTVPAATITRRPSGKFMDVVHPSSDMTHARTEPTVPVARTGLSLQPMGAIINDIAPPENTVALSEAAAEALELAEPPVTLSDEALQAAEEVEPLAVTSEQDAATEYQHMADTVAASLEQSAAEQVVSPAPYTDEPQGASTSEQAVAETEAPLATPFLADAVVDKRPLGGEQPAAGTAIAESPAVVDGTSEAVSSSDETAPAVPLQPELSRDVMALESSESKPSTASMADALSQSLAGAGASDDVSMFEVAAAQPAAEAASAPKAKSGWSTVLFIIIFLLLGAAGGAAAYFFLLQ